MVEITKFFNKKKRDLSWKSNDGDDSKRLRESSLDDSIANVTNTDVFTESLMWKDCSNSLYLHKTVGRRDEKSSPDVWKSKRQSDLRRKPVKLIEWSNVFYDQQIWGIWTWTTGEG